MLYRYCHANLYFQFDYRYCHIFFTVTIIFYHYCYLEWLVTI